MRVYTHEQLLSTLEDAIEAAQMAIFKSLKGADESTRLDSLDQLDALEGVHKQIIIKLDRLAEETSEYE